MEEKLLHGKEVRDAVRAFEQISAQERAQVAQEHVATRENAPVASAQESVVQFDGQQESAAEPRTEAQAQAAADAAAQMPVATRNDTRAGDRAGIMKIQGEKA